MRAFFLLLLAAAALGCQRKELPPPEPGPYRPPVLPVLGKPGLEYLGVNARGYQEYRWLKDGSVLIHVPGGEFEIGWARRYNRAKRAKVRLSPYLIGKHEVTWGQMKAFCAAAHYSPPPMQWWHPKDDEPAVEMFWFDAANYCKWAGLRLPTEMEWEYASRGRENWHYPWGNEPPFDGQVSRANLGWEDDTDGVYRTSPAGSFPAGASAVGCLDMLGNVWEWCADWYGPALPAGVDPTGPTTGEGRVIRGGGWSSELKTGPAEERISVPPGEQQSDIGFRVALTP